MKLTGDMLQETVNAEPRKAPPYVMWLPPHGAAVECPSLETAQRAAEKTAARNPGKVVAVYELVGFAFKPIEEPEFVPSGPADSKQARVLELSAAHQVDDDIVVSDNRR